MITFESLGEGPKQEKRGDGGTIVPWTASYIATGPRMLWGPEKSNCVRDIVLQAKIGGWSQGEGIPSMASQLRGSTSQPLRWGERVRIQGQYP